MHSYMKLPPFFVEMLVEQILFRHRESFIDLANSWHGKLWNVNKLWRDAYLRKLARCKYIHYFRPPESGFSNTYKYKYAMYLRDPDAGCNVNVFIGPFYVSRHLISTLIEDGYLHEMNFRTTFVPFLRTQMNEVPRYKDLFAYSKRCGELTQSLDSNFIDIFFESKSDLASDLIINLHIVEEISNKVKVYLVSILSLVQIETLKVSIKLNSLLVEFPKFPKHLHHLISKSLKRLVINSTDSYYKPDSSFVATTNWVYFIDFVATSCPILHWLQLHLLFRNQDQSYIQSLVVFITEQLFPALDEQTFHIIFAIKNSSACKSKCTSETSAKYKRIVTVND